MQLSGAADHVSVAISDAAGNVVRTLDLGAQEAGTRFFDWDGKSDSGSAVPAGHYTFAVTATAAGKAVTFDTLMHATVEGIVSTPSGALLQFSNDGNQIAFDAVTGNRARCSRHRASQLQPIQQICRDHQRPSRLRRLHRLCLLVASAARQTRVSLVSPSDS